MARPELGTKRVCPTTGRKFYDMNRDPVVSPYTGEVIPRSAFEPAMKPAASTRARPDEDEEDTEDPAGGAEMVSLDDVDEGEDAAAAVDDDVTLEETPASDPSPPSGGTDGVSQDGGAPSSEPSEPKPSDPKPGADEGSDTGTSDKATEKDEDEGADDDVILSEGNAPPLTDAPLPKSSNTRGKASKDDDDDLTVATEDDLNPRRKKIAAGGCSSAPTHEGDSNVLGAFLLAGTVIVATRRRRVL